MEIELIGLSLQIHTLQPILLIQERQTKEQYSIPLPLEEATYLISLFHAKENESLYQRVDILERIRTCHKNIEQIALVFSPEGILITQVQVRSWFRKKYISYPLITGVSIALYHDMALHASATLLNHLTKAKTSELKRTFDTALASLEASIANDAISTEHNLLGMHPETTLIM